MADAILAQGGIYQIKNTGNGKMYVGSAVNARSRLQYHLSSLRRSIHANQKLQRAWDRYGEASFEMSVVEYVPNVLELVPREQHWIDKLSAVDSGYNIRRVAQSNQGLKASAETKARMSAAMLGRVMSPESRAKMSVSQRLVGKRHSEAVRAQMSADRRGRRHTEEAKAKIGAAFAGRALRPELVARRTIALKAALAKRGPISISDESRARMSASKKGKPSKGRKPVLLFGVNYESITAAALAVGRNPQWVKLRMGTDCAPEGDMHARARPSAETRKKMAESIKLALNADGIQARRCATKKANQQARLAE